MKKRATKRAFYNTLNELYYYNEGIYMENGYNYYKRQKQAINKGLASYKLLDKEYYTMQEYNASDNILACYNATV